jgi:TPR repeat protein
MNIFISSIAYANENAEATCQQMFDRITTDSVTECLKVAEKTAALTQYSIGRLYDDGIIDGIRENGVLVKHVKNSNEAIKWYVRAADNGDDGAAYLLGTKYLHGNGVVKNYNDAIKWLKLAVKNKNENAASELEMIYGGVEPRRVAIGFPRNETIAYMWSLIAYANIQATNPSKTNTYLENIKNWERHLTHRQIETGQLMAKKCINSKYELCE